MYLDLNHWVAVGGQPTKSATLLLSRDGIWLDRGVCGGSADLKGPKNPLTRSSVVGCCWAR